MNAAILFVSKWCLGILERKKAPRRDYLRTSYAPAYDIFFTESSGIYGCTLYHRYARALDYNTSRIYSQEATIIR